MNVKQDLEPSGDGQQQQPAQSQRRPRGFAATAAAGSAGDSPGSAGKGRKERDKEKERTKLRERHRRAITSRMLAGFRQYGNFPLPARADMNDVLAALAREAGWTVEADGTTYRSALAGPVPSSVTTPLAPLPSTQLVPVSFPRLCSVPANGQRSPFLFSPTRHRMTCGSPCRTVDAICLNLRSPMALLSFPR